MPSRYIKNTVVLAKTEVTAGTDAAPTGLANALLVSDVSITPLDAQNVSRNNVKGYFGGDEELVGPASIKVSFTVELAGSGSADTAPAWGALLTACAFAETTLTTPDRVEYLPVSASLKTATIYYYDDGVLHKLLGAMGNCTLSAKVGERPTLKFEFTGLDGGISATANAVPTLTAWKKPVVMMLANVVDVTLGATYADGALSGGTLYPSNGIELNFGNVVAFTPLLGVEDVDVTDRNITGSTQLKLTAAEEVALMANVKANTTQSLAMTIGTTAGNKILLYAPAAQLTTPTKQAINGKRMIGYNVRAIPAAGNDELLIACV